MINTPPPNDLAGGLIVKQHPNSRLSQTAATSGSPESHHQQNHHNHQHHAHHSAHHQQPLNNQTLPHTSIMNGTTSVDRGGGTLPSNTINSVVSVLPNGGQEANGEVISASCLLERDYYGCYCLKFIVKNGTHITEEKVLEDFGAYGDVVDVRGPGLFSGLRGNHVYVRFIDR